MSIKKIALLLIVFTIMLMVGCNSTSINFDDSLRKKYIDDGFIVMEFTTDAEKIDPISKSQGAIAIFRAEVKNEHITVIKYKDWRAADEMERKVKEEIKLSESLGGPKMLYKRYGIVLASGTSYALDLLG